MKIISFLGCAPYNEIKYTHPEFPKINTTVSTCFFQEALYNFYQPEYTYVLLTNKVENECPKNRDKSNWQALQEIFEEKGYRNLKAIKDIPEKNTPEDIWEIFHKITPIVEPNDEIIFDITYSFRSIPLVALLSISYLRAVSNVNIKGLLYGAYDAKNENNEAPTFDLLPIISLLDWITATDQFIKTGNGQQLVDLLTKNNKENSSTNQLASNIKNISQGLQLLRPIHVIEEAANLPHSIQQAKESVIKEIPPFEELLKKVEEDYQDLVLAIDKPSDNDNNQEENKGKEQKREELAKLLNMIDWYYKKDKIVQSICLAREWLVSLLCYQLDIDYMDVKQRGEAEILLSGGKIGDRQSIYLEQWQQFDSQITKKFNIIWQGDDYLLANLRNDVLHAGFRKKYRSAEEIEQKFFPIINELKCLAEMVNLIEK